MVKRASAESPELITIGKHWARGGKRYDDASHSYWELVYIIEGHGVLTVAKKQYALEAGKLVLVRPETHHSSAVTKDGYLSYCLFIKCPGWKIIPSRVNSIEQVLQERFVFEVLLARLLERFTLSAKEEALSGFLFALVEVLKVELAAEPSRSTVRSPRVVSIAERARSFIEENYDKPIVVSDVAEAAHMSPSRLAHIFKEATSFSIIRYLVRYRISMAKQLLLSHPHTPVKKVAMDTGFNSLNHFYLQFKKLTGMSPKRFRLLHCVVHERGTRR